MTSKYIPECPRQGNATSTVLTNRSKYITVISDESYESRKKTDATVFRDAVGSRSEKQQHQKGTRPMHRTSLTFEKEPQIPSYITSNKKEYSGKKNVQFVTRPSQCPSLHLSQFQIGRNDHVTWPEKSEKSMSLEGHTIHEDRSRWQREMQGTNMQNSLTFHSNEEMNSLSKNGLTDKSAVKKDFDYNPYQKQPLPETFDIITGDSNATQRRGDFKKVSGNRLLQSARVETSEGILG